MPHARRRRPDRRAPGAVLPALALALAACSGAGGPAGLASAAELAADAGPLPPPPDSHAAHRAYQSRSGPEGAIGACPTCHHQPHSRAIAFDPSVTLPGGTSLAGASAVSGQRAATCSVACHAPFGAPARPVSWGDELTCRNCHGAVRPSGAPASAHDPIFSDLDPASGVLQPPALAPDSTWCWSCHDAGAAEHASGAVSLLPRAALEQGCLGCHAATGQTLRTAAGPGYREATPPQLSGWTDPAGSDWHGARAGTGFSGTLLPPYAPGQPPLPCLTCHAVHASGNAFLFAPVVNGRPVPPGSIGRSGVGAQALCNACHSTGRHASCSNPAGGCHTDNPDPSWPDVFNPGNPVDPMPDGSPCFFCHGHEGIRNWTVPDPGHSGAQSGPTCIHCHSPRAPGTDPGAPPVVASGRTSSSIPFYGTPDPPVPLLAQGTAFDVTATSATVYWETNVPATSVVEYGQGTAGLLAGALDPRCQPLYGLPCRATYHTVRLAGLSPATTYVFRLRSEDDFRNLAIGPPASFTTLAPEQPPAPRLLPVGYLALPLPAPESAPVALSWLAVALPGGGPVEYRAQLAAGSSFDGPLLLDGGWVPDTSASVAVQVPLWPDGATYTWRVQARDATSGLRSPWSLPDAFAAWRYEPGPP